MEKRVLLAFVLLFSLSIISAIPGIPHQFYGEVSVNGELIQDNNIVSAVVNGYEYSTITKNGKYGLAPNSFFVEDINSNNLGKTINFYVGGMEAGTFKFQNNALTNLDFSLITECGDGFCLGDETCSRCNEDCGECSTPTIYIKSPIKNQIYEETKIDIDVYSDQEISIWEYSINSKTKVVFQPNITLTLFDGDYDLEIFGTNTGRQTGYKKISFSVDLPYDYCGDGDCKGDEGCSNCNVDCGACPVPGSGGSSGGGGGSGGGGFISSLVKKIFPSTDSSEENNPVEVEIPVDVPEETNTEVPEETQESVRFGDGITGAVVGFSKTSLGKVISLLLLIIVLLGVILMLVHLRNKKKKTSASEYIEPEEEN